MTGTSPCTGATRDGVVVIIPAKPLARAKTRLRTSSAIDSRACALAFLLDTIHAATRALSVRAVMVVSDDPTIRRRAAELGCHLADQGPAPGLNAAIRNGAAHAARTLGPGPCAALVADLPALRPAELDEALAEACAGPGSAFVRDAAGHGTTLLVAGAAELLRPSFGTSSAHEHESSGALPLRAAVPTLRHDVDTPADLDTAARLGLGPSSRAIYQRLTAARPDNATPAGGFLLSMSPTILSLPAQ
jgi:2-phospho-L-lactate guanylyltransferase